MDDRRPPMHWEIALHDDIAALEPTWREIEARGCSTAFQSFDWLATWYEVIGRHGAAEPVIVTARHADADEVQAILPLCRIRRRGYWEITFADLAVGDFAGPVFLPEAFVRPGATAALMDAVVRALPRGDVIRLDKLSATVGGRPNPLRDLADVVPFPVGVWGIAVDADAVSKPPPGANKRLFAKAGKARLEIAEKFDQAFEWCEDPDRRPTIFETLLDLRIARFEALGRPDLLKEPMWRDFYRALAARRMSRLRVAVLSMKIDGKTIAAELGIGYGSAFHHLMGAFAMGGWESYRPGHQLMIEIMRQCPARGFDYLDLTIGDERYKKELGAERRLLYETRIPVTLKGRLICLAWRLKVALRAHPRLFALIKRLVGRQPQPVRQAAAKTAE